jgi:hypothetical protein
VTDPGAASPGRGRAGRAISGEALAWAVIGVAFVHALAVSWRKWGDVSVDTGRELDLPRRLAEGQLLYRDARFYYGPLAPYVNALLYRLFGVHLDVLVWAGVASAALMAIALYRLARFFVPRWASAAVVVAFLYLCAFAHLYVGAIFNFVLPYTFAATYGIIAAAWSLVFLIDHVRSGSRAAFFLSAGCLALSALSKMETFAPVAAAHAVFLASLFWIRPPRRALYAFGYAGALSLVLAVYGAFWLSVGPTLWSGNLLGVLNPGSEKFVLWAMGLVDLKGSLGAVGLSLLLLAITLGVGLVAARLLAGRRVPAAAAWAVVAALAAAAYFGYRYWQLHVHFRFLPVAMAIAVVAISVLFLKRRDRRPEWLVHLLLWVFGFACLWRILLNSKPHHYGFYLLPVGLVCAGVLFFAYAPRLAGSGPWPARVFGALGLGMLGASVSLAFAGSGPLYKLHTYEVSTPRGRLRIINRWQLEGPAIQTLSGLPPETRLVTIPQGAGLLYFAGLREGDTMFSYLPMEVSDAAADAELLSRLKGNPPDVIAWVGIPMEEFGSFGFGLDYATQSMAWIHNEYVAVTNPAAAIVLMERKRKITAESRFLDLSPSPPPPDSGRTLTGTVLESFDENGITFANLRTDASRVWVAVAQAKVPVGSTITVVGARPTTAEAGGYRRRFDSVLAGRLAAPRAASIGPGGGGTARADSSEGKTVAGVFAERASLKDRQVAVRGTVVKFLPGIMGRNWLHLKDGSGSSGAKDDDLTVTTADTARVGDEVLVRGTVRLDRDFGMGYAYPVLIEDGRISK